MDSSRHERSANPSDIAPKLATSFAERIYRNHALFPFANVGVHWLTGIRTNSHLHSDRRVSDFYPHGSLYESTQNISMVIDDRAIGCLALLPVYEALLIHIGGRL